MLVFPTLIHADRVPTLENMALIKWTNDKGVDCRFSLFDKVSTTWQDTGTRLETSNLKNLEMDYRDCQTRFMYVMEDWINKNGTSDYPYSWKGLIELLKDVERDAVATELTKVLKSKGVTL